MTSWLLNFPNINLNIAEPIDEFVRYININYGEVFVAAKKMLSIFINGIKALNKINYKGSLNDPSKLPPHRDNNAQWDKEDDDEWNKNKKK